jgi:hypothetical protein
MVQLNFQNQPWFALNGSKFVWSSDAWGSDASQHFLDPFSLTHMLHGVLFYGIVSLLFPNVRWHWRMAFVFFMEAGWEMLENADFIVNRFRTATAQTEYAGDTIFNSIGDLFACMSGAFIARAIGWKWSIALFIAVEVFLAIWIRDGLILELLMLAYPIEWIKAWQMGHG